MEEDWTKKERKEDCVTNERLWEEIMGRDKERRKWKSNEEKQKERKRVRCWLLWTRERVICSLNGSLERGPYSCDFYSVCNLRK